VLELVRYYNSIHARLRSDVGAVSQRRPVRNRRWSEQVRLRERKSAEFHGSTWAKKDPYPEMFPGQRRRFFDYEPGFGGFGVYTPQFGAMSSGPIISLADIAAMFPPIGALLATLGALESSTPSSNVIPFPGGNRGGPPRSCPPSSPPPDDPCRVAREQLEKLQSQARLLFEINRIAGPESHARRVYNSTVSDLNALTEMHNQLCPHHQVLPLRALPLGPISIRSTR
jgi:hypothetical protein